MDNTKLGELMSKHWVHVATAVALVAGAAVLLPAAAPSLGVVVSFFWPLLLSTTFFLVVIALLVRISPLPVGAAMSGEDLIDFVTGAPLEHQQPEAAEDGAVE